MPYTSKRLGIALDFTRERGAPPVRVLISVRAMSVVGDTSSRSGTVGGLQRPGHQLEKSAPREATNGFFLNFKGKPFLGSFWFHVSKGSLASICADAHPKFLTISRLSVSVWTMANANVGDPNSDLLNE